MVKNRFIIFKHFNATLREKSPTEFDAGGLGFSQNTTNFDVSRKFDKLNVVEQNTEMRISK
jgi:iron complex outermembrane receptor protein